MRYLHFEKGNIGVISNGAGYCMATNDLLALHGSRSSNFLDLGGQAYHEKVTSSLVIMEKNEDTDAIIVNMYCGQLPADKVAVVIRDAYEKNYCTKPIVCRIKGTNSEEANAIIKSIPSDKIICVDDFNEAALKVIEMGKKAR
jgi:succinyl-CoA synthetase beta subunit